MIVARKIGAEFEGALAMPHWNRSIPAIARTADAKAPSAFALYFWQPLIVCYGQAIGGDDETLFNSAALVFPSPGLRIGAD